MKKYVLDSKFLYLYKRPSIGYYLHPIHKTVKSVSLKKNKAYAKHEITGELMTEMGFYLNEPSFPILTYSLHPLFPSKRKLRDYYNLSKITIN